MKYSQKQELLNLLGVTGFTILASSIFCELTLAQIRPDTTLGTDQSTILAPGNPTNTSPGELINGGARQEGNLFHSFEDFNVNNGQRVYFDNPNGVARIFSRVTGNNLSNIMGTLGVWDNIEKQIGRADLFLINPNGILFGPNARLDLGGSFISSTASSIIFADGTEFSAINPSASLLKISIPVGLRFGTNVGSIRNQSTRLGVGINRTLALVGGEIIFDENSFTTTGLGTGVGRVDIGGVGAREQVSLHPVLQGWALGYETVQSFADIFLQPGSRVSFKFSKDNLQGAEEIHFYGRNIILNAAQIAAFSGENPQPAKITIYASESIELGGRTLFFGFPSGSGVNTTNLNSNSERAGDIEIVAKNLRLIDAAAITTNTFLSSTVPGGNITINVAQSIQLSDGSRISASTLGKGRAGNLSITTNELQISRGSAIAADTIGIGSGGNITLNVPNLLELRNKSTITTTSEGISDSGNIRINTRFLIGAEDSDITANSSGGRGGAINISAEGTLGFSVQDNRTTSSNDITAFSEQGADLNGIVELNTPEIDPSQGLLELSEAAVIDPTALVAQNPCKQGKASELTISGRGGLPPSITEDLSSGAVQVGLVEPVPTQSRQTEETKIFTPATSTTIEPVQGWIFNEKGEVVLTAYNPTVTEPQRLPSKSTTCTP